MKSTMKITLHEIRVKDLVGGYLDNSKPNENGEYLGDGSVVGYGGRLDIRPAFQREFVYEPHQSKAVIESLLNGFPINVMYWTKIDGDNRYEVLDGQQRTISICEYYKGLFSIPSNGADSDPMYFSGLPSNISKDFLEYPLQVYICEGSHSDKLDWFKTINIAGKQMNSQELRNAVYAGPWLADAKRRFSRPHAHLNHICEGYVSGVPKNQDLLEKAIEWAKNKDETIEDYMARNQDMPSAQALWLHFQAVVAWAKATFTVPRNELKALDWGLLYRKHHQDSLDPVAIEKEVKSLMEDDEVRKKSGIYYYVLDRKDKHLNLRSFTPAMKRSMYERQNQTCKECKKRFRFEEMEGDHIDPWVDGGKTILENGQMLCKPCNRRKSSK